MRRLVFAIGLAGTIAGCTPPPSANAPCSAPASGGAVDAEVARVLDDWHEAAAKADEERYFAHFAEGGVFLGTDMTERWTVPAFRKYAHPHFAKGKAWTMRATRREITFVGGAAWFDEDLETARLGPARGSGVLVRDEAGKWKIAQYNLSIPIPNEKFADVRALIDGAPKPAPSPSP